MGYTTGYMDAREYIVTINSGSSSVKFALFSYPELTKVYDGKADRIGMPGTYLTVKDHQSGQIERTTIEDGQAIPHLIAAIERLAPTNAIRAIGHRIVHGGPKYRKTTRLTESVLADLTALTSFAPRHLPQALGLVRTFLATYANTAQYACFDTAFFKTLPRLATLLPLPRQYEAMGVQRYGFHGLSYTYILSELTKLDATIVNKKIILCHLGSGASVTAIKNGQPWDTSMGFSPNSGVPMGTRTGDLDPGVAEYLLTAGGLTIDAFSHLVNYESGSLGVSGTTADMETLIKQAPTDPHAEEAVSYFCYSVQKAIGSMAGSLGGADLLVFSGGMAEQSPEIRRRIAEPLEYLGFTVNLTLNAVNSTRISEATSRGIIYLIPTDEEQTIAAEVSPFIA